MTLREIFKQADRMPPATRIAFLKNHRDRNRPRSIIAKELQAALVREVVKQLKRGK